jgi:hypothetical protein
MMMRRRRGRRRRTLVIMRSFFSQTFSTLFWICEHHLSIRTAHLFQTQGMELPCDRKQLQTERPGFANCLLCNIKSDVMGLKTVTVAWWWGRGKSVKRQYLAH